MRSLRNTGVVGSPADARARDLHDVEWFSFDVFDTVVTRSVPRPGDVFLLLGERLGEHCGCSPETFAEVRRAAESDLRRSLQPGEDLKLEAIHREILRRRQLPDDLLAEFMAAEADAELGCARLWEPGAALLERWRTLARFVGFLSDMYLPATVVRRLLEQVGAWKDGDSVYVSGEERATKASGSLFTVVGARLGIEPRRWVHFGDHASSDVAVPRRLSIQAVRTAAPVAATRTTAVFADSPSADRTRAWRIASCLQRAAGAPPAALSPHQREVWSLGAHVLAPVVLWYAHSVLQLAMATGRRNLWFLSRDGEIVWKAAQIANAMVGFQGKLHYVLASRQGLHLPSFTGFDEEARRWLLANPTAATPRDVGQRAGFQPPELAAWLDASASACASDEPIDRHRQPLWEILQTEPHASHLRAAASAQLAAATRYFASVSDSERLGIVDIGWNANLQCSFQRVLGRTDLIGFYLGLFSRNPEVGADAVRPLLFDFAACAPVQYLGGVAVLEALFAGTHAGLVAYEEDDRGDPGGRLAAPESWSAQTAWGIGLLHEAACAGVTMMVREGVVPTKEEVATLLSGLINRPSRGDATPLASWPTQNLQNRLVSEPLVPRQSVAKMLGHTLRTGTAPALHWEAGGLIIHGHYRYALLRVLRRLSREVHLWRS
jgi:FMN phosphatase YigB (HAD superfamily)